MNTTTLIVPAITKLNEKYTAVLKWSNSIDPFIFKAIEKGEQVIAYWQSGIFETPFGKQSWVSCCVDTLKNLRDPNQQLFWFDLMIPNSQLKEQFFQDWIKLLEQQDRLLLELTLSEQIRWQALANRNQVIEYCKILQQCQDEKTNYAKAVNYIHQQLDEKIIEWEASLRKLCQDLDRQSPLERLNFALVNKLLAIPINDNDPEISRLLQEQNLEDLLNYLDSHQLSPIVKETYENYLFCKQCLQESEKRKHLVIAVGTSLGKPIWRSLDVSKFGGQPETTLYDISPSYRRLSGSQWSEILDSKDILLQNINSMLLAGLGKVPTSSAFKEISQILHNAVLEREYGLPYPIEILADKMSFHSVTFFPLNESGLQGIFKIYVEKNEKTKMNLVLVGEINAPLGEINIIHPEKDSPEVELFLFLVALAYRDILVARPQLGKEIKVKGSNQSSTKKAWRYLARIKYDGKGSLSSLGDPEKVLKEFSKYKPHLRTYHKRQLPKGWKASGKALELAQKYDFLLPEGYTFVSPSIIDRDETIRQEFKSLSLLNLYFSS